MVDPIEAPDFASKPPTPDKLMPVVRSDPEKDRNGFSKALREKMEQELETARKDKKDVLEIGHDSDQDEGQHKHKQDESSGDTAGPARHHGDSEKAGAEHIDLKA